MGTADNAHYDEAQDGAADCQLNTACQHDGFLHIVEPFCEILIRHYLIILTPPIINLLPA